MSGFPDARKVKKMGTRLPGIDSVELKPTGCGKRCNTRGMARLNRYCRDAWETLQ